RARLQPGEDRQRSEQGGQAADGDRLGPARADLHRRALRAELPPHPRACLGIRLLVELGLDHLHDRPAACVLPVARLDRRWPASPAKGAAPADARPADAPRTPPRRRDRRLTPPLVATFTECRTSSARTAKNGRSTTTEKRA